MEQRTQITMLWVDDQRGPEKHFKNASKQKEPENPEGTKDMNYIAFRELMNMYDINFVWVKTFPEFANYITEHGVPEFVSFDRDLTKAPGYDGKNGSDCARWLSEYCASKGIEIPKYFIHSANVNAYDEITSALKTNTLFMPQNPKFKFKRHDKLELNETKIRKIVKESVKRFLKESDNDYDGNYWQLIKNEYHNLCNLETKVPYHLKGEIHSMATKLQGMLSDIERMGTLSRI